MSPGALSQGGTTPGADVGLCKTKVMGHCHRATVGTDLFLVPTMLNLPVQIRTLRKVRLSHLLGAQEGHMVRPIPWCSPCASPGVDLWVPALTAQGAEAGRSGSG